jgi:hypothetical protein
LLTDAYRISDPMRTRSGGISEMAWQHADEAIKAQDAGLDLVMDGVQKGRPLLTMSR